jgi:hypothetical protein
MTPQDDLAAFLAARLDEEASDAEKSLALFIRFEAKPGDWTRLMCDPVMGPFGGQTATRDIATGLYVGKMSDPARVLREVEFKRAILAEHDPEPWGEPHPELLRCGQGHGDEYWEEWPCAEVRALAALYDGHPGYRAEWKP